MNDFPPDDNDQDPYLEGPSPHPSAWQDYFEAEFSCRINEAAGQIIASAVAAAEARRSGLDRLITVNTREFSGSVHEGGGAGGLLATVAVDGSLNGRFYPLYDGNGNVTEYLDETGTLKGHFEYDSFGVCTAMSGAAGELSFRFATQYEDSETGLLYYGYRYLDPVAGRWLSRDPIGERGGINLYAFVWNDGVNYIDVNGMSGTRNWREISRKREKKEFEGGSSSVQCGQSSTLTVTVSITVTASGTIKFNDKFSATLGLNGTYTFFNALTYSLPACTGKPCDGKATKKIVVDVEYDAVVYEFERWHPPIAGVGVGLGSLTVVMTPGYWATERKNAIENVASPHAQLVDISSSGECCQTKEEKD